MNWLNLIESLITPPGIVIIIMLLALCYRGRITSRFFIIVSLCILYTMSIPLIANRLENYLDKYPVLDLSKTHNAQAIVVLTAGIDYAPEFQQFSPSKEGLARARYAAVVQKATQLPLLVSGGIDDSLTDTQSEASITADFIQTLGASVTYLEEDSQNTYENALNSAFLLKTNRIKNIILVTSAIHMKRSIAEFERYDINVLAAPTLKASVPMPLSVDDLLPTELHKTRAVLHELLGIQWYRLRGWLQ